MVKIIAEAYNTSEALVQSIYNRMSGPTSAPVPFIVLEFEVMQALGLNIKTDSVRFV